MTRILRYIQQRLSLRLGLLIVLIITVAFTLLFGFLFYRGKRYVQRAAIDRATQLLDNTAERINGIMDETETVTNFMAQTTPRHLTPDSLLVFTRRTVRENAFLTGFAISMEPDFFPEMGRYFSAYSYGTGLPTSTRQVMFPIASPRCAKDLSSTSMLCGTRHHVRLGKHAGSMRSMIIMRGRSHRQTY